MVEQRHLDDRPGSDAALEALDVLAVAVGERLVVDEVLRGASGGRVGHAGVAECALGLRLEPRACGRRTADVAGGHLVHDHPAERQLPLAQRPPEEVRLGQRLDLRHGDDQEGRASEESRSRRLGGPAREPVDHSLEAEQELRQVAQ